VNEHEGIGLTDAIEVLQLELTQAQLQAAGHAVWVGGYPCRASR
jgi:hypothetical protein